MLARLPEGKTGQLVCDFNDLFQTGENQWPSTIHSSFFVYNQPQPASDFHCRIQHSELYMLVSISKLCCHGPYLGFQRPYQKYEHPSSLGSLGVVSAEVSAGAMGSDSMMMGFAHNISYTIILLHMEVFLVMEVPQIFQN